MGRKLLADPHLPRKLKEGRPNDVLPCIYCYTCLSAPYLGEPVRCAVNSDTGLEFLRPQNRAAKRRRIVIIGGGPGGMEAARQLDAAGQDVILLEKHDRLGGTLLFAALAYDANEKLLNWLTRQVSNSQIDVRLSTDATVGLVKSLQPDEVLVATGATRSMPPIPGSDLPHVFSGDDMRNLMLGVESPELKRKVGFAERLAMKAGAATGATSNLDLVRAASKRWMPFGRRIAIIGGGLVGLELAEFLHDRERSVAVVGNEVRFGGGLTLVRRLRVIETLREHGVKLHQNASQISIEKGSVKFLDEKGENVVVEADNVIVAQGAKSDLSIAEELKAAGFSVCAFGDCAEIGFIEGAMRGASNVVKSILGETVPPENLLHPARS